jgi:FkbM family methyltransferase
MLTLKSLATSSIHYVIGDIGWAELRMRLGKLSKNSYYDYLTNLIMQRAEGSCGSVWIDIGAHEGEILREMLANAPAAEFLAFEPIPKFYQILKHRFPGSNVHVFDIGLSDHPGEVVFNFVTTNPAYSGFKQREYPSDNETVEQILVKTETLDSIIQPMNLGKVKFIKIDVEGAELQVLTGSIETLSRDRPIVVFEHGLGAADYYNTRPEQVFELFSSCGLRISSLSGFLRRRRSFTKDEFSKIFYNHVDYYFVAHP